MTLLHHYRKLHMAVVGLIVLIGGCASLPEDFTRTESFAIIDTAGTALGREIQPLVKQNPDQSGFYALAEGIDAFAARLLLVGAAQKTIDLQYYIWHDDLTGRVLHNRLLDAADRGVRVRLLLDDMDTAGKDDLLHLIDAHPNIEIRLYNPFANRGLRVGDFITDTKRIDHRMHNKTMTFDNQVAVFGGRNIGDEYFDAADSVGFSDLDAIGIGPVVGEISDQFDLYWNSQWVYPLVAFTPDEPVTAERITGYRKQSDAYLNDAAQSRYSAAIHTLDMVDKDILDFDFTWGRWVLVYDQPSKVEAKEVNADTHLAPQLKRALDDAKNEVIIVSPYFVPGPEFTQYLTGLVEKGVRVRIMTNSLAANDVSLVYAGYQRYRKPLLKGGVELYEFKPIKGVEKIEKKSKWTGSSRASLHGKFFAFDQRYVFIGSFNLDPRSVALNTELGVYFESPEYAALIGDAFDNQAINKGYRLQLTSDGNLQWVTRENGQDLYFDHAPETSWWKRFSTDVFSIFVPESEL